MPMRETLFLGRAEVTRLLTMETALAVVESAFADHGRGETRMPAKLYLDLPEQDRVTVQMPGSAPVLATLAATCPQLPPSWKPLGVPTRRAALQRLWSGG